MELDQSFLNQARFAYLGLPLLVLTSSVAHAADAVPPGSSVPSIGLLQVTFALGAVLAVIALLAWLLRRWAPGHTAAGGLLRVVAGVMVGPRERLVLVEMGDTWLLLGVATSNVSLLHSMPKPQSAPSALEAAPAGSFARLFKQAMSRRRAS